MPKKDHTFVNEFLEFLLDVSELLPLPLETPYAWVRRQRGTSRKGYAAVLSNLTKRGAIKITSKNNQKFVQLTQKGQLEILLSKAALVHQKKWDGKWRLFMFDIPEASKAKRDHLRFLLKKHNFHKLQASVFIHPYPLNREALAYLLQTGLIAYIRILRVDEIDDDKDLRKKFKL